MSSVFEGRSGIDHEQAAQAAGAGCRVQSVVRTAGRHELSVVTRVLLVLLYTLLDGWCSRTIASFSLVAMDQGLR